MPERSDVLTDLARAVRAEVAAQRDAIESILDACKRAELRTCTKTIELQPGEVVVAASEVRDLVIALNAMRAEQSQLRTGKRT